MKKPAKVLLGLATLWTLVYPLFFGAGIVAFWVTFYTRILSLADPDLTTAPKSPVEYILLLPPMILTLALLAGLVYYYIVHAIRNPRIPRAAKLLWIMFLFLDNVLVMPIYWYFYIWREPKTAPTLYPGGYERPPIERPRRTMR